MHLYENFSEIFEDMVSLSENKSRKYLTNKILANSRNVPAFIEQFITPFLSPLF